MKKKEPLLLPPPGSGRFRELFRPTFRLRSAFLPKNAPPPDFLLLAAVLLLALEGTAMIYSAGSAYATFRYDDPTFFIRKQTLWLAVGLVMMFAVSRVKTEAVEGIAGVAYLFTLVLLLLVLAVGFVGNGAQRWISLGPVTVQPSEIAKMTLVLMMARYFSVYEDLALEPKNARRIFWYGTVYPALFLLAVVILVMLQKHLSCIIILGLIGFLLIVSSGVRLKYILGFTGIGAAGVACLALFTDYTKERITVWQNPEAYRLTGGWQTLQGLMAIGSGGLFGLGAGNSLLKYCYISEPANDMIFTVLCEETGFFGALATLLLFALLIARGYRTALRADTVFARLTAFGISTKIAVQTLLNVAVVTNTIPNTGISLPFFSYGGSSLVMLFVEMGILLSISRFARAQA